MITEKFVFEKRPYLEDSTLEEIQAIKNNVIIYDPQVIYIEELPVVSPFSMELAFDQIDILGKDLGQHGLLIDVRNTKRPDAKSRRVVNQRFGQLCENLSHVAFCTGKNFLFNTTVWFVMNQTNLESFSINKTIAEAVQSIKDKINND